MKTLNIPLEDKEYKELEKKKDGMTWKEFILKFLNYGDKNGA